MNRGATSHLAEGGGASATGAAGSVGADAACDCSRPRLPWRRVGQPGRVADWPSSCIGASRTDDREEAALQGLEPVPRTPDARHRLSRSCGAGGSPFARTRALGSDARARRIHCDTPSRARPGAGGPRTPDAEQAYRSSLTRDGTSVPWAPSAPWRHLADEYGRAAAGRPSHAPCPSLAPLDIDERCCGRSRAASG